MQFRLVKRGEIVQKLSFFAQKDKNASFIHNEFKLLRNYPSYFKIFLREL